MQAELNINADISLPGNETYYAVKGDANSRVLNITVRSMGKRVTIPSGSQAVFNAEKRNGQKRTDNAVVLSDGRMSFTLKQWHLETVGELLCNVSVNNAQDGSSLSTIPFTIEVKDSPKAVVNDT